TGGVDDRLARPPDCASVQPAAGQGERHLPGQLPLTHLQLGSSHRCRCYGRPRIRGRAPHRTAPHRTEARLCVGGEIFLPPTDKSASVAEMGGGSVAGMGGGSVAGTGGGSVAEMGAGWVARGWGHLRLSSHSLARV